MSLLFPFLLIVGAVVAHPTPADSPPAQVTVQTGFKFAGYTEPEFQRRRDTGQGGLGLYQ